MRELVVTANPAAFFSWDLPQYTTALLAGFSAMLQDFYQGRLKKFGFHTDEETSCLHYPGFGALPG